MQIEEDIYQDIHFSHSKIETDVLVFAVECATFVIISIRGFYYVAHPLAILQKSHVADKWLYFMYNIELMSLPW